MEFALLVGDFHFWISISDDRLHIDPETTPAGPICPIIHLTSDLPENVGSQLVTIGKVVNWLWVWINWINTKAVKVLRNCF